MDHFDKEHICSYNKPIHIPSKPIGLYDPYFEKDSCGAGCIVNINGIPSHQVLKDSRLVLERMEHRGACGCDSDTGDGAGVMTAIPHAYYANILKESQNVILPGPKGYATGLFFLSTQTADQCKEIFAKIANERDLTVLTWRKVPVDRSKIGKLARDTEPLILQVFIVPKDPTLSENVLKHKVYLVRKYATHRIPSYNLRFYICSLSLYSVVYKGQFRVDQLWEYYVDLRDPKYETYFAMVHSRFSTNTFPSWERAQPLRYICHNGEINTLRGNVNFMAAREGIMKANPAIPGGYTSDELPLLYPVIENGVSDSGALDNALEFFLLAGGKSLPEATANLIPEARKHNFDDREHQNHSLLEDTMSLYSGLENNEKNLNGPPQTFYNPYLTNLPNDLNQNDMTLTKYPMPLNLNFVKRPYKKHPVASFYKWSSGWMEPWDGPALVIFGGDGRYVGAALDRNGLRPARFYLTRSGLLVLASEVGVYDCPPNDSIIRKGRLKPGKMIIVDIEKKEFVHDDDIKLQIALAKPYAAWLSLKAIKLRDLYRAHDEALAARNPTFRELIFENNTPHSDTLDRAANPNTNLLVNGSLSAPKMSVSSTNSSPSSISNLDSSSEEEEEKATSGVTDPLKPTPSVSGGANDLTSGNIKRFYRTILHDRRLPIFGFTAETVNMLVLPMIKQRKEALGSMGNDSPLACLSEYNPAIFDYFKQMFAQVTNPAIDPFREKNVMSLSVWVGPAIDPLSTDFETRTDLIPRIYLEQPVLSLFDMEVIKNTNYRGLRTKVIEITFRACEGVNGLETGIDRVCNEAAIAVESGYTLIVLSDKLDSKFGPESIPIPALLALGAVHHFLLSKKLRLKTGLIVETGCIRQVAHICLLLGYGADALCPYMIYEVVAGLRDEDLLWLPQEKESEGVSNEFMTDQKIFEHFRDAAEKGISKVMAKMGISTLHSYRGAQIFEAIGLGPAIIEKCFKGTPSRLGGVTFEIVASELLAQQFKAFSPRDSDNLLLLDPGFYHWRDGGEKHMNSPEAIANLQKASKSNDPEAYARFKEANELANAYVTLRGQLLFDFEARARLILSSPPGSELGGVGIVPLRENAEHGPDLTNGLVMTNGHVSAAILGEPYPNGVGSIIPGSIDIDMVEDAACIVKKFCTGAMSFGSISIEAHRNLALAMNAIGGKSNTGEGGEDPSRYQPGAPDRSAIKQIASGRFGVTSDYLTNADLLQIKVAQGAKPGEGGELPGYKVTHEIAKTRHSIPGVGLISPPPHHDIYSVEDLAELIYDLKSANPVAKISVKLVSEVGVGVVAAGVAKCKAEHITISGHDGGTGASSWTGIKHAGLPWEMGLSETHQTLVLNGLRSRVILQTDGQIRTGRDVVMAALLGADEVAFSTAPLITLGCTMMRKCHLNTCPVGIATQDPDLRKKFAGKPEYVINYLFMIAEEVREYMAKLGFRTYADMVGHTEKLVVNPNPVNNKARSLNLSPILESVLPLSLIQTQRGGTISQDFKLEAKLEITVMDRVKKFLDSSVDDPILNLNLEITNVDRAFGAMISHEISKRFGEKGLSIKGKHLNIFFTGHAGQSFGAFLAPGITLTLEGDSNDYVGKGLSGGEIIIYPSSLDLNSPTPPYNVDDINHFQSNENIIIGNACLYGAVCGRAFFRGQAAERFCVRNSGAIAVSEGCGDHGCEYMTGGKVVILGMPGRNFAAGMSGGFAYVYDPTHSKFPSRCNMAMIDLEIIGTDKYSEGHKRPKIDHSEDCAFLIEILQEFIAKTRSILAQKILDDWPVTSKNFYKVFPKDYRAALDELSQKSALEKAGRSQQDILKELKLYKQESLFENKLNDPYEDEEGTGVGDIEDLGTSVPRTPTAEAIPGKPSMSDHNIPEINVFKEENDQLASINKPVYSDKATVNPSVLQEKLKYLDVQDRKKSRYKKEEIPDADENLDKTRGFVKYNRHKNPYRPVEERIKDWKEIYDFPNVRKTLRLQAARCMDCGVPFCQSSNGCPLGNIIPKFNDLVFKNNWREALETLLQTNNFPEFTGRVCPAPCEGACVLGINEPPVNIKNIECAIIDHAFSRKWIKPQPPSLRTGKVIGIIGSGPSGLAAAAQLNKAGHTVRVYERNECIGGLLRYGIPSMKLNKDILQRRIDLLSREGVEFYVNCKVGDPDQYLDNNNSVHGDHHRNLHHLSNGDDGHLLPLGIQDGRQMLPTNLLSRLVKSRDAMLKEHDGILIAAGSTVPRDLPIPGRKLKGIHFAMEFLENWQKNLAKHPNLHDFKLSEAGHLAVKDKNVIVIGGGDTGVDCIGTSLRLKAKSVVTFEILQEPPKNRSPANPWPEWPKVFKVEYGHEESKLVQDKDPRVFCIMSKEFVEAEKNPGHVGGMKTALIDWEKAPTGRWCMKEKPGTERIFEADLILLALGFVGPETELLKYFGLDTDLRGNIATPRMKYGTASPKIYAAGDCRRGQSLVVWAINEGRQAARQIDIDLMGRTSLAGPGGIVHTVPKLIVNRAR